MKIANDVRDRLLRLHARLEKALVTEPANGLVVDREEAEDLIHVIYVYLTR